MAACTIKTPWKEPALCHDQENLNWDEALSSAMNVFWEHGYEETSLPQLLKGMSLSRGSLYKAFTDKRTLFFDVLKKYENEAVLPAVELLQNPDMGDGAVRIQTVFNSVLDAVKNGDQRGCLLCTAAAGSAPHDKEIADEVQRLMEQMSVGFNVAVNNTSAFSDRDNEFKLNVASVLLTQYVGLRVLARSGSPVATLQQGIAGIIQFVENSN